MNFKYQKSLFFICFLTLSSIVGAFSIDQTRSGIRVVFSNHDIFHYMTPTLTEVGKSMIDRVITKIPEDKEYKVMVTAHTDNTAIKDINKFRFPSNWELSSYKAASVLRYIENQKLKNLKEIAMMSHGSTKPIEPNYTVDGRRSNRRIVMNIVYDITKTKTTEKPPEKAKDTKKKPPPSIKPGIYKDYMYSSMETCREIEKSSIHTMLFEDEDVGITKANEQVVNSIANYIAHRGRLISVIMEAHSSIKEDVLQNNITAITRAKNVSTILSRIIKPGVIKILPYGNTLTRENRRDFAKVNINNRIKITTMRCLDKYQPIFRMNH